MSGTPAAALTPVTRHGVGLKVSRRNSFRLQRRRASDEVTRGCPKVLESHENPTKPVQTLRSIVPGNCGLGFNCPR